MVQPSRGCTVSTDANKALVTEFFARFTAWDVEGAMAILADDVSWWIAGKPDQLVSAGLYDKAKLARLFRRMARNLPDGLQMRVHSMVAEGDKVAAEVTSHGRLQNERVYEQEYHFLLTLRDGKIAGVREYLDTQHVHTVWEAP
jgi:ketosteroid isomerase-like protein